MLILALDTATEAVSTAVVDTATDHVLGRGRFVGPAAHGEVLAVLVDEALTQAGVHPGDLGAIGVGRGPGPYTGLRVGLVHAEVLGWALGIPVHGVCTLDVLAAQAVAGGLDEPFLAVTDARRREVYWARYEAGGTRVAGPGVDSPQRVAEHDLPAVGSGTARYPQWFPDARPPHHPDPAVLAGIVAGLVTRAAAPEVAPLYLRRPDAVAAPTRKRVTPA